MEYKQNEASGYRNSFSLVDHNLQISPFLPYGRGIVPYIIF